MRAKTVLPLLGIAALAVFPFAVTSPYYLHLLVVIAIYSVLLLGLDIVFGYTGEVSIGHAALFGVGAYTAGVLKFQCDAGIFWQPVCDAGFASTTTRHVTNLVGGASALASGWGFWC